jgi:hypothetical protein
VRKQKTVIAETINGKNSKSSINASRYVKCFATIKHSSTAPAVVNVATILKKLPATAETNDEPVVNIFVRDLLCFFFVAMSPPNRDQAAITVLTRTSPPSG